MQKAVLKLSGMDCSACVIVVDGTLEDTKGILSAKTNYAASKIEITFDEKKITIDSIITLIKKTGYEVSASN